MRSDGHQSQLLYSLCTLLLTVLGSPRPSESSTSVAAEEPVQRRRRRHRMPAMTLAGFVSLLLGASMALMLCGSVTLVIGFILMPWVAGLVVVLYLVGLVSGLSGLGRAVLCPNFPSSAPKDLQGNVYIYFQQIMCLIIPHFTKLCLIAVLSAMLRRAQYSPNVHLYRCALTTHGRNRLLISKPEEATRV